VDAKSIGMYSAIEKLKRDLYRDWQLYLLLVPAVAYYILFIYKPFYGLQIAFKDYSLFKGIAASKWVGFEHFVKFFQGPYFLRTLKNTFFIGLYGVVFSFPAPIIFALLLNEMQNKKLRGMIQTLSYMPYFISIVVVAGLVVNLLSPSTGLINMIIKKFGGEPIYFLTQPNMFRPIYILMYIWKDTGFASIIYFAALSSIDPQLYEAAYMDGANKFKRMMHITLPGILPTIMILLILKLGTILNVGYESIILLYQPATYEKADVINTFVYRTGIAEGRYDVATAVGLFNGVVSLILVSASNIISKKTTEYGIW
jgi:putative aldouronate transport system permease protein